MSDNNSQKHIFILYVADQQLSKQFYQKLFGAEPYMDVPGITQFDLPGGAARLGIMPEKGIAAILGNAVPHPSAGSGIPRAEVYLYVTDPDHYYLQFIEAGGTAVSAGEMRNWGEYVAYGADPDGHIWAFAKN
ncbi:MAG: hypothetical protein LPJ89_00440 [Hymenobacteraceae bacterium]|nr:hypothetical protein [Hymenobacteraceae bacterium]MDX5396308.1 hypothetical protein [Hymenobacteraceae bacterium]MDX5442232.1 hypothetical protein [Hymenobacteraceae bacterium]MDX5512367.1 hypothetical protein [Hymenobacteraceae bacterium]